MAWPEVAGEARMIRPAIALILTAGLWWGALTFAVAQDAAPPDLAGIYLCDGADLDGQSYSGAVEITAHGDVWAMRWVFREGEGQGFGMLDGDVLSVIFQTEGGIGWAAYRVQREGSALTLRGRWTAPGAPLLATETLIKTAAKTLDDVKGPRRGV